MSGEYKRIRIMWPDHLGLARGKYLPAWRAAKGGTGHCISLFSLGFDRNMTPHAGAHNFDGTPDMEVSIAMDQVRPSWEKGVGILVPDLYRNDKPVDMAPRHVLQRAIRSWEELGYVPQLGIELEAFLLQPDDKGGWKPLDTPGGYVYGTGRAVDPDGVISEIMDTAESVGLRLESVHSEYDNGQFELTLGHDTALRACDDAFIFKVMAREVAQRRGYLLTFMGKPFSDRGGSGTHINLSLLKDGENAFVGPSKQNDETSDLSSLARQCMAGLLAHHRGMAAICAPTVNAYKRLRPGNMVGYWANWGRDHRGCTIRIPPAHGDAVRLEHRLSDGAVNPHIAAAAVLVAARLGIANKPSLPPAETADCWEKSDSEVAVASDLAGALDDLEADKELVSALGPAFVDAFLTVKRAEWNRYIAHTTDWELSEYLPFL